MVLFPFTPTQTPDCLFAFSNVLIAPLTQLSLAPLSSKHLSPCWSPWDSTTCMPLPRESAGLCLDGNIIQLKSALLNRLIKLIGWGMPEERHCPCPSHRVFKFPGGVVLSSDFDSGNLSHAQRISSTSYDIWIGTDHPQSNYRTWFYFSAIGLAKGSSVSFTVKNMHNQTKLLNEGLVPVFRNCSQKLWRRVGSPIRNMGFNDEGYLQFTFTHQVEEQETLFAFFYPWSIEDNQGLLKQVAQDAHKLGLYFHAATLVNSLEGRPVELVVITSKSGITKHKEALQDSLLFPNNDPPALFPSKKCIFVSARVHPGEVPSSHVMNGILKGLVANSVASRALLEQFVFYLVPIINPDGVFRGHYRADSNGVNLNRYYINPNPVLHSPIYGIKKLILNLHNTKRLFGCLDLHAHAARKGAFIYGNYSTQLNTQLSICLFPKILSLNSKIFEYQGSNFTEKNMYCKDRKDSVSKEGSARVALFKATKNPYFWTLECNYNMGKYENKLCSRNQSGQSQSLDPDSLDVALINSYQPTDRVQSKQFYTIESYQSLGQDILDSFLDLVGCHPHSRIHNTESRFQTLDNLRLNLLTGLLKMTPYQFEPEYRKILMALKSDKSLVVQRSVRALHEIFIRRQVINIEEFLKSGPTPKIEVRIRKRPTSISFRKSVKVLSQQLTSDSSPNHYPSFKNIPLDPPECSDDIQRQYQQSNKLLVIRQVRIFNLSIPHPGKSLSRKSRVSQRVQVLASKLKKQVKSIEPH